MKQTYQNILLIALRKIGDTIIATSGAQMLRQAYPKAKITMLVRPLTKEIVENNPVIDEVMIYNYTHKTSGKEIWQVVHQLKEKDFDLCIVLDNKPRSAMLGWLAGIPQRVGFEKIEFRNIYLKLFYTDIINIKHESLRTQQVKNHEIFINRFTGRQDKARMVMAEVTPAGQAKVKTMLALDRKELPTDYNSCVKIGLCLRSGCLTKDWPLERFVQVVQSLHEKYQAVFFVIGSAADRKTAEEFSQRVDASVKNLCGQTTLPELGTVIGAMDVFLTVDTGAAHIAATTETPLVVVYGSTSPRRWGPYTDNIINLVPTAACHPCDGTKIKCQGPYCLSTIEAATVNAAVQKQINKKEWCGRE